MTNEDAETPMITEKFDQTFRRYPVTFRSAVEVHALAGRESAIAIRRDPTSIADQYRKFLSEIVKLSGRDELDYLVFALSLAMANFAERHSKAPTREEVLVGLFRGAISQAITDLKRGLKRSGKDPLLLEIFAADLNIKSREKKTGGDIALIVDVCNQKTGRTIIPICFQAKRAAPSGGASVDIRRFNKSDPVRGDHQLKSLKSFAEEGANCAYLFFNNHTDFRVDTPILPLVKAVDDIVGSDHPLDVDLAVETIDVASFILHLVNNRKNAASSIGELEPMLAKLVEGDVSHLVVLSSESQAWEKSLEKFGTKYTTVSRSTSNAGFAELELAFEAANSYDLRHDAEAPGYHHAPGSGNGG
ncbi:hypothetical protein [Rhizobium lusitanum]|uniref:Restriction endonuclease n=1 Tax=Rhizobium lusitanum TaxID=293958 RepID=A0A7X0MFD3_9HYPH|nr:hypothetical protein [Rhizobium lusitanum]MBB6488872.1 hypothetical protein [Rhizobium lusitanum]